MKRYHTSFLQVSGSGDIKLTKDGNVLLHEMQIQHPTASLIARAATAQDDVTGDGTTSNVLIIGELLKQADRYIQEGLHPRIVCEGFEKAKDIALKVLDNLKIPTTASETNPHQQRELLVHVAKTSLATKLSGEMADILTDIVVDAVLTIAKGSPDQLVDLHMIEIMEMQHKSDTDSKLIKGGGVEVWES